MIPNNTIKYVFSELSDAINLTIIRADQPGNAPAYPYATYKGISITNESAHQNIRSSSGVNMTVYEFTDEVYSFNVLDKNRVDRCREYCEDALHWFKSLDGRAVGSASGVTFQLINNQVQDRTSILDSDYESKLGFDVRFLYMNEYVEEVGQIEFVEITPTVDDVEGEPFTIPEE